MRPATALALLLATLAPATVAALDWSGRLGFQYLRDDTWTAEERTSAPTLDVDLELDARGFLVSPRVLVWGAAVAYRRTDATRPGDVESRRDYLTYRLRTSLFANPRSPVSVSAHASRVTDDSSVRDTLADATFTSATLAESYGVDARYRSPGRPSMSLGVGRLEITRDDGVRPETHLTGDTLTAGLNHGSTNFSYGVQYRGSFSRGTFASDNRDEHRGNMNVVAKLAPALTLRLSDVYYLRTPVESSPYNQRAEANSLNAQVVHRPEDSTQQQALSYTYYHGMKASPLSPEAERLYHSLGYTISRSFDGSRWQLTGIAGLGYTEDRLAIEIARGASESLGALVVWRRPGEGRSLELRGGPTVAARQAIDTGENDFGYGASAGTTLGRTWERLTGQASYDVAYASDVSASGGTSFRQTLAATASGPLAGGQVTGQVTASGERRHDPLFGDGASRSMAGDLWYRWRRLDLRFQVSAQEGLAAAPDSSVGGDGLFLAPSYDTHTLYASIYASSALTRRLSVRSSARITSIDLPDRPAAEELEARAGLIYATGVFELAIEDRFVKAGANRFNQLSCTVSRRFGSRFR